MGYKGWTDREDLDWDKIDATAPPRLDRDIYWGKVIVADAKKTKESNKPSVAIQVEATIRYENEKLDKPRKLFDNLVLTQSGAFKAKQVCEALGIDPPENSGFPAVSAFAKEILGKKLWMLVGTRMYEGKTNNNIERYLIEDDVDEVHAQEIGDREEEDDDDAPPKRRSRARDDSDDDDDAPKRRRTAPEEQSASNNGKGKSEDLNEADEEPPKRRRRRPAAEAT